MLKKEKRKITNLYHSPWNHTPTKLYNLNDKNFKFLSPHFFSLISKYKLSTSTTQQRYVNSTWWLLSLGDKKLVEVFHMRLSMNTYLITKRLQPKRSGHKADRQLGIASCPHLWRSLMGIVLRVWWSGLHPITPILKSDGCKKFTCICAWFSRWNIEISGLPW